MALGFHMGGASKFTPTEVKAGTISYTPYTWTAVEGTYNLKTNTFTPISTTTSAWNGSGVQIYDIAEGRFVRGNTGRITTLAQVYVGTSWDNVELTAAETNVMATSLDVNRGTYYFYEYIQ